MTTTNQKNISSHSNTGNNTGYGTGVPQFTLAKISTCFNLRGYASLSSHHITHHKIKNIQKYIYIKKIYNIRNNSKIIKKVYMCEDKKNTCSCFYR